MNAQLHAIVTLLSLMNPAICGLMFSRVEVGRERSARVKDALKVCVTIAAILTFAALLGVQVLEVFGISLDAFNVAGGGVLAWIGFGMLRGDSNKSELMDESKTHGSNTLTPVILFGASPGTITGVIALAGAHSDPGVPVTALVAIAVAVAVTGFAMLLFSRVAGHRRNGGFVGDAISRYMGLIVVAMGVQFMLAGFRAFMAAGVNS